MNKTSKFKKALSVVLVLMVTLSCLTLIPMTTGATDAASGTAQNDNEIVTLDIADGSKNLGVRMKLTDPHGFMVITNVKRNGTVVSANEYGTTIGEVGFIFLSEKNIEANEVTKELVVEQGTKARGEAYGATRFCSTYTELPTSALNTTIYFVAYAIIDGVTVTSGVRYINPYEEALDAAEDGYFGNTETGVGVSVEEKALYRAMIEYYCAYATPNDMPVWES